VEVKYNRNSSVVKPKIRISRPEKFLLTNPSFYLILLGELVSQRGISLRSDVFKRHHGPYRREEINQMVGKVLDRLRMGLQKTQAGILEGLSRSIKGHRTLDEEVLDEIEATLLQADVGPETTSKIISRIRERGRREKMEGLKAVKKVVKEEILAIMDSAPTADMSHSMSIPRPYVIMVVGVNGTGKTTTAGKLARKFGKEGKKVLLAAADTFRAAATEQLEIWAKRTGADIVRHKSGSDPAAVAFDALSAALSRRTDILIIDTAGRLHTRTNLMEQLKKIKRVLGGLLEGAPHEALLVLDATTGQNAIPQVDYFNQAVGISGIVLSKLDGTAKGGVVIAIRDRLSIPLRMIGIGEGPDDLRDFDPSEFVEALFGG